MLDIYLYLSIINYLDAEKKKMRIIPSLLHLRLGIPDLQVQFENTDLMEQVLSQLKDVFI